MSRTSIPTFPRENLTTAYEAVKGTCFAPGLPHCGYFRISEYACFHRVKDEWRKRDLIATWLLEGAGNRRITIYGFLKDSE